MAEWQTHRFQKPARAISCGFDSHLAHMKEIKKLEPIKNGFNEAKKEFREKTATLILGGFGLVAALAWNEAIKTLFETILPRNSELIGKFLYAFIVTAILAIISMNLRKISESNAPKD